MLPRDNDPRFAQGLLEGPTLPLNALVRADDFKRAAAYAADKARQAHRTIFGQAPEGHRSRHPTVDWAEQRVGRGGYGYLTDEAPDARREPKWLGKRATLKCNQFVYDALAASGRRPGRMDDGRIPSASEWGDPNSVIGGYQAVVGPARLGDVIGDGRHVGIFAPLPNGRPGTISAAAPMTDGGVHGGVVHNDWGFRGDESRRTVWRQVER